MRILLVAGPCPYCVAGVLSLLNKESPKNVCARRCYSLFLSPMIVCAIVLPGVLLTVEQRVAKKYTRMPV